MARTFVYRDRRLADVEAAVMAESIEITNLQEQIDASQMLAERMELLQRQNVHMVAMAMLADEQQKLAGDRYEVSDGSAEALARGMLRRWSPETATAVSRDAAYLGAGGHPLSAAEVQLLGGIRPADKESPADAMAAAGIDRHVARSLVSVALGRWLRQAPETSGWAPREVGVLLPLRLETLFEGAGDNWRMLLRVIPDEASILRDSSTVTAAEAEFLAAFWAGSRVGQFGPGARGVDWLADPRGQVAWEALASRVTPQRAAYLLGAFPARAENGGFVAPVPPERIGDPRLQRIGGLPAQLQVCIVDRNKGRLTPDVLEPRLPDDQFRLPGGEDDFKENWLLSWPRAQQVGMGKEFALPAGVTPQTIDALYVYGIGDESPEDHFRAHADAGDLALMRLGAPTNTIQGAPAAALDQDAESWRIIVGRRLSGEIGAAVPDIGKALCGNPKALPYLGGDSRDLDDSRLMVAALWPALWGHFHRDVWSRVDDFHGLWKWSLEALHPEGPLLPLRIGAQPYGLLPVTPLRGWQPAGDEFDAIETRLVKQLGALLPKWTKAAVDRGTIAKGGTKNLLRLLAQPGVSANYVYRSFVNVDWLTSVYGGGAGGAFRGAASALWGPTAELMQDGSVPHAYLATGFAAPLDLPLIGSARLLPAGLTLFEMAQQIYQIDHPRFADMFFGFGRELDGVMRHIVPHSLLVRLAMHSMFLVKAWLVESANGTDRPVVNPVIWNDEIAETAIEHDQGAFRGVYDAGQGQPEIIEMARRHEEWIAQLFGTLDRYLSPGPDPLKPDFDQVMQLKLPADREAGLERALRATLDSAGHRLDPLATGIAWRRLKQQLDSGNARHRLGAYGWLDGPFGGRPGPTAAGRLHAPSRTQAITGVVLRDKHLSSGNEHAPGAPNIWEMNLSSAPVRTALAMAEDVRAGFHIHEIVGRQVEAIVGGKDQIERLRAAAPLRAARPDLRESCNGILALQRLRSRNDGIPDVLSNDAAIAERQRDALDALDAALDAYGDLLVAEGVHQVVSGHADLAADAMDAAAGFARPPEFAFARTPPSGYRLGTSVLSVLRHVEPPDDDDDALPIERADPSLASFLDELFADGDLWVWKMRLPDGSQRATWLSQMGLSPLETLLLSEDTMTEIVRCARQQPDGKVTGPPVHRLIRQLAGLLGGPPTLAEASRAEDIASADAGEEQLRVGGELAQRLASLRRALVDFTDPERTEPDDDARRDWLRRALGWGVLPAVEGKPRRRLFDLLLGDGEPGAGELSDLVESGKATLRKRLQDEVPADASPQTLAKAISDLLLPGSRLAVTAMWEADRLRAATGLRSDAPARAVESDWLSVVAAVRPSLARLEAFQLETGLLDPPLSALAAWTNTDDHWQVDDVVAENTRQREQGDLSRLLHGRFVAAFGPAGVWQADNVAVSLVDTFSEAIPMAQRTTYAAFGFNAPAARPPQAILLAVPPRADAPLDDDTLVDIIEQTRQLLRARAAAPEDLAGFPIMPSMWFDGASAMRLRLDAGSQHWR